ncbi:MAG: hypothetical protein ACYTJ0_00030 [Planctomycetota bacterium]|jgi:hypothetical protein
MLSLPSRRIRVALAAAVAAVTMTFTAPGKAQGTSGMLPDPVSSRELSRYADRLGLSEQQRLAIELFHEQYRASFRDLREKEIEQFLRDSGGLGAMGMGADPKAMERAIRDFERIMGRIKGLDESLFDQIQATLTEAQALRLPGARLARERTRYGTGLTRMVGFLNPASRVDLSEVLADMELTPAEQEAIEPLVGSYETGLTSRMRDLHEESLDLAREATRAVAGIEMNEAVMADPERRREMMEAMRTMWLELTRRITDRSMEISDLGRSTIPRLQPLISPVAGFELHTGFYRRGYREFADVPSPAAVRFEEALALDDLDDEKRQAIADLRGVFFRGIYRINGDAADLIDKQRRARQVFNFGGDEEALREHEEKLEDLREQRGQANTRAILALDALLGSESAEGLPTLITGETEQSKDIAGMLMTQDGQAIQVLLEPAETTPGAGGADPFLPGPISPRDVQRYADMLRLDEEKRTILSTLHQDYEAVFREMAGESIGAVARAQQSLWQLGENGAMVPPSEADIGRLYNLRRNAMRTILQADETFFANLEALSTEQQRTTMERIRLSRQRDVYNRARGAESFTTGGMGGIRFGAWQLDGSREAMIDLSRLVDEADLADEQLTSIDTVLLEYERSATALFRGFFESDLRFQEALDKLNASSAAARMQTEGGNRLGFADGYRDILESQGRDTRDARRRLIDVNRQTVDRIVAALADEAGAPVRLLYEKRAFPDEFEDSRSAAPRLRAALELPDLTADQRSAIAQISAEFQGEHERLSREMVAVRMNSAGGDRMDWQQRVDGQRRVERLRSERDDLNEKSLVRLRSVLSDEQLARLQGDGSS